MCELCGGFSRPQKERAGTTTESQPGQEKELDKNRKHKVVSKKGVRSCQKYRGRGKFNRKENNFSVMLVNIRGLKSKQVSLKKVMKKEV